MSGLRVFSPAKINLHLDILRRRPDGFHDLSTVFMALDWGDELTFDPVGDGDTIEATGAFAHEIPTGPDNLVLQAVALLRERTGAAIPPLRVRLHKRIPPQAGLGGGSSNAAAALVGLDQLFGLGLEDDAIEALATNLGSDCAFFVRGGTQSAAGRGEVLAPLEVEQLFTVLVVVPRCSVSTAEAFRALDLSRLGLQTDQGILLDYLRCGDVAPFPEVHNTFERSVCEANPEIAATLERLRQFGAEAVLLSGSGSACFGIFPVREEAENASAMWDLGARAVQVCWPWPVGVQSLG